MHSRFIGRIVVYVGNAFDSFIFYKLGYFFDKPCFVYHIRYFGNDYFKSAVFALGNFGFCPYYYLSSACGICRSYAGSAHNDARRGKVGTFYILHKVLKLCFGVIYKTAHRVNHFAEVVRRNVCSHTDGNTV